MNILDLWAPILVSSVFVWIFSAMVWMIFPWHKTDFSKTDNEDAVRSSLKGLAPGFYNIPHVLDQKALKDPEVQKKFEDGPLAYITIVPSGLPAMGGKLILSFVNYLLVGIVCAYMVTRTSVPDASYLHTFRIAGTVAFVSYGFAYIQDSNWFGRPWSITAKSMLDAFLYALLTGGVFGWLV
jgi:hypothetical protein